MGNVPKIRFKGYTDEWGEYRLGDIAASFEYGLNVAAKEYDGTNKYLRITDINDSSRLFESSGVTSPDTDIAKAENYRLQKGDILFARTGASVGKTYIYKESDGKVYYAGFLIRVKICPEYSPNFVFQNTLTPRYKKYIQITSQRSGQPGVNAQEYANFTINIPEFAEQEKVAFLLTRLDSLIILYQRKCDTLEKAKRYFLQNLFPRKGERVPRIRFNGFSGEWELGKLSDLTFHYTKKNRRNLALRPYAITSESGFIPQEEAHEEFGYMKDTDQSAYNIVEPYSFGYNPARINIGSIGYYDGKEDIIVSSLYEIFKTTDDIDNTFLQYWFKTDEFQNDIRRLQEGSVRLYFYYDKLCECEMLVPSIREQSQIGHFLQMFDALLSLYQEKCTFLSELKKYLLRNMFV